MKFFFLIKYFYLILLFIVVVLFLLLFCYIINEFTRVFCTSYMLIVCLVGLSLKHDLIIHVVVKRQMG